MAAVLSQGRTQHRCQCRHKGRGLEDTPPVGGAGVPGVWQQFSWSPGPILLLVLAAASAANVTPRPSCAWLELGIWAKVSERGGFTQGRQVCSFKDHRGAQRVELGAVRCSRAEETERSPADASPGRDPRRQAELCFSLSYQIGFVDHWVISGLPRGLEPGRGALKAWRGLSPELPPGGIWNPSLTPRQKGAAGTGSLGPHRPGVH